MRFPEDTCLGAKTQLVMGIFSSFLCDFVGFFRFRFIALDCLM